MRYEWIPGSGAIHAREFNLDAQDTATPLLHAYFYFHPRDEQLHYLALSATGSVDEGVTEVLEGGAL